MPTKYAEGTDVSIERSEAEVKAVLRRYGCYDITSGEYQGLTFLVAHYLKRQLRIEVKMPLLASFKLNRSGNTNSPRMARMSWEKECRRQWRVLVLLLKAKFEAVMASPEIFEIEFLGYIVDPATGQTIGSQIVPQIASAYESDHPRPLLLGPLGNGGTERKGNWREVKDGS